jgi:hypothetical protein
VAGAARFSRIARSTGPASIARTWSQRDGYGGYYIPPDRFRFYFGPRHYFRIGVLPSIYVGYPRFEYRAYTFVLLDADGYYLVDRNYPDVRLAVTVQL